MINLTGKTLKNQYFLRERVSSGGVADNYLAWDTLRSAKMRVKVLQHDLSESPRVIDKLDKETRNFQDLTHPYIVSFYEFGIEYGFIFIVTAWVDGIDLKKRMEELDRPLQFIEVLTILQPICNALNFAHQKGLYHCDIKPSNILLDRNGKDIFLADFGITHASQEKALRKNAYIAPEQISQGIVSARTDIYSLGIMVYQMLSVRYQVDIKNPISILLKRFSNEHSYLTLQPPSNFKLKTPLGVLPVIQKATSKNPSERHKSVVEFLNALVQAQKMENQLLLPQAINSKLANKEKTMPESFCPEHGPYDASLGLCPYPHKWTSSPLGMSSLLDDDLTTEIPSHRRSGRGILDFDEKEELPSPPADRGTREAFCPEHGPYDASLDKCPYPHAGGRTPISLDDIDYLDSKKFRTERKNIGLRVFVSSTYEDLKEYREAVFKSIHSMFGYADDMLFWSADERNALTVSLDRVRQCDLVILLVAHRYGYIPIGQEYSITELEYRTARQAKIPVLVFFVDEKISWPPSYIETDKQEKLNKFKKLIETDVVRKTFRTTDELRALVSEALSNFKDTHPEKPWAFRRTLIVKSRMELHSEPDIVTQIGDSEDELPLLLSIKRSQDLGSHINNLAESITSNPNDDSINEILDGFRDQLERYTAKSWASHRICKVRLQNGSDEKMYVTKKNLSELTSSLLHKILDNSKSASSPRPRAVNFATPQPMSRIDEDDDITELPVSRSKAGDTENNHKVQSIGGSNRFLGISISDKQIYSVGEDSGWVEWHPFYQESIRKNFPNCKFCIHPFSFEEVRFNSFKDTLEGYFFENMDKAGFLDATIQIVLSRQSIGQIIAEIAETVAIFQSKGKIHGDLKPKNILLTKTGPVLIDSLDLNPGDLSHGWTPKWSAPEQVLQVPVTYAADIYPLGLLILNVLDGKLLGEVRKFIVPTLNNPEKEHNVFYNPSVFFDGQEVIKRGKKEWVSFVESCLKFDSTLRPKSASEFYRKLSSLLEKFPLAGDVNVNLENGSLVAATLLDGSKTVAKLISDEI